MSKKSIKEFDNRGKNDDEDLEEVNFAEFILKAECDDDPALDGEDDEYDMTDEFEGREDDDFECALKSQCEILFFKQ